MGPILPLASTAPRLLVANAARYGVVSSAAAVDCRFDFALRGRVNTRCSYSVVSGAVRLQDRVVRARVHADERGGEPVWVEAEHGGYRLDVARRVHHQEVSTRASVPATLGKGQGAKEIGHNLARERPKFGHNLVRKRQNPLRANDQSLVLWPIDENMGTNLQAFYKHFYIGCLNTKTAITFCKNKK